MTLSNPFAEVPLHDLLCGWEEAAEPPADEGWILAESDTYGLEIERDDEAGMFASDDDALVYVRLRAKAGSVLHQMALAIHLAQEAENKAAAEAAGYTVKGAWTEETETRMAWYYIRPGEAERRYAGQTVTAAWSAAWRDLQEKWPD